MPVTSFSPAQNSPTVRAEKHPSLSERLLKYRLENGLTLQKLGYLCGVNHVTISNACNGRKLTLRIAAKIDRFLRSVNA